MSMKRVLPVRLSFDAVGPLVEWVHGDGAPYTEPFFEDTVARLARQNPANARALRPRSSLDALVSPSAPDALSLEAMIFHVSRCGSTLLAQMLARRPDHVVLSEPQILDDIARRLRTAIAPSDDELVRWLRGAVAALVDAAGPKPKRVFLKLNCWDIFSLPLLRRAFPSAPCLFVYRDPIEVLVSLMRRPSLTLVRGTLSPEQLGVTVSERDALTREENGAAALGALYREATKHAGELRPIAYADLPGAMLAGLAHCRFTSGETETMLAAAAFDAKNPGERFVSDTRRKRDEASAMLRAASARWAEPAYAAWLATAGRG